MDENIKQIQDISLDMFKSFIQICTTHGLRYFLLGGTCLGAVRHSGFIPWDDDIDVGMPRTDYNLFLKFAPKELPSHVFLQTSKTDKYYPNNYAKLRNSNTTFIESAVSKLNINHGVYMDIFPLDGYIKSKKREFLDTVYKKRISMIYCSNNHKNTYNFNTILKRSLISLIYKTIFPTFRCARDLRDKLIRSQPYDDCELVHNYCGAWGKKEIVPKAYFGSGTAGCFEGISVMLPEKYDLYLSQMYGCYMQLPKEEDRVTHHYTEVIDLQKPYIVYKR